MAYILLPLLAVVIIFTRYVYCQSVTLHSPSDGFLEPNNPLQLVGIAGNGAATTYTQVFTTDADLAKPGLRPIVTSTQTVTATNTFIVSASGSIHVGLEASALVGTTAVETVPGEVFTETGSPTVEAIVPRDSASTVSIPRLSSIPDTFTVSIPSIPDTFTVSIPSIPGTFTPTDTAKPSPNRSAVVGGTVGGFALLFLILFVCWLFCKQRKNRRQMNQLKNDAEAISPWQFDSPNKNPTNTPPILPFSRSIGGQPKQSRSRQAMDAQAQEELRATQESLNGLVQTERDGSRDSQIVVLQQRMVEILERLGRVEERELNEYPPDYESQA